MSNTDHWPILQRLDSEFLGSLRSFMVIGKDGEGTILVTNDGKPYWFGNIAIGGDKGKMIIANSPTLISNVGNEEIVEMAHRRDQILLLNKQGRLFSFADSKHYNSWDIFNLFNYSTYPIQNIFQFVSVRCGIGHSLALTTDGKVLAWGDNQYCQAGVYCEDVVQSEEPRLLSQLAPYRVLAIACGGYHSLALTDKRVVYSWGSNCAGQLGHQFNLGIKRYCSIPIRVVMDTSFGTVQSIAAGQFHSLLLTEEGKVYQCGNATLPPSSKPDHCVGFQYVMTLVPGLLPVTQIASHPEVSLSIAITSDWQCFVWGHLNDKLVQFPVKLSCDTSFIDAAYYFKSQHRNTPHFVKVQGFTISNRSFLNESSAQLNSSTRVDNVVSEMFDRKDKNADVVFVFGGGSGGDCDQPQAKQTIWAHRCLLMIMSQYFNRMFQQSWLPSNSEPSPSNPLTINIEPYSYSVFYSYLRFLYTGQFQVDHHDLVELFELSSCYLEDRLRQHCLTAMKQNITIDNCCLLYQLADHYPIQELEQMVVRFVKRKGFQVFQTDGFKIMDNSLCKKLCLTIGEMNYS